MAPRGRALSRGERQSTVISISSTYSRSGVAECTGQQLCRDQGAWMVLSYIARARVYLLRCSGKRIGYLSTVAIVLLRSNNNFCVATRNGGLIASAWAGMVALGQSGYMEVCL